MRLSFPLSLFFSVISAAPLEPRASLPLPSRLVYQFSNPTWIENVAARSNGDLLLTMMTAPELHLLRGAQGPSPEVELVHGFANLTGLMGISETTEDTFVVAGANFSGIGVVVPGTFSIWQVKFCGRHPKVSKVVDIAEAGFLNGVVALPWDKNQVMIADSALGKVFKVDVKAKKYQVAVEVPEMDPPANAAAQIGVNGVHIQNGFLYWTNTLLSTLFRVQIDKNGFIAVGAKVETVAVTTSPPDDFILDKKGTAWTATNPNNTVLAISPDGKSVVVAGSISEMTIAGSTAVAFGRTPKDQDILYVVTDGALIAPVNGTITEGGKVVAIDTKGFT